MTTPDQRSATTIWWQWLLVMATGFGVGTYIVSLAVLNRIDSEMILGAIVLSILGLLQSLIWGKFVSNHFNWIFATLIGWLLFYFLLSTSLLPPTVAGGRLPLSDPVSAAELGFTLGVFQWMILRGKIQDASWWIVANTIGFGLGLPAIGMPGILLASNYLGNFARDSAMTLLFNTLRVAEFGALGGVITGTITGLCLLWLLRRRTA